jgi:hypothetical protein
MTSQMLTPPLSRDVARDFAIKWQGGKDEKSEAESFWNDFFRRLCGIDDTKLAGIEFQYAVTSSTSGNKNWIDVYWKNVAIIEHKSRGEDLDKAELLFGRHLNQGVFLRASIEKLYGTQLNGTD